MEDIIVEQIPEKVRLLNKRAWITKDLSVTDMQKILKYLKKIPTEFCYTSKALEQWYEGIDMEKVNNIKEGESETVEYKKGSLLITRYSFRLFTAEEVK